MDYYFKLTAGKKAALLDLTVQCSSFRMNDNLFSKINNMTSLMTANAHILRGEQEKEITGEGRRGT